MPRQLSHQPVSFIGSSGSGKTTLVSALIRFCVARGEIVAAIKHTHHPVRTLTRRGDSERFLDAGANTVIVADSREALIWTRETVSDPISYSSPRDLAGLLEADRLLIEGFKGLGAWPRILVERDGIELIRPVPDVIAIAGPATGVSGIARFEPDDLEGIVRFLDALL